MKKQLYIAYGSNLNRAQMSFRCPTAEVVAKSWIHDHRLVFQGAPKGAHANVIPAQGCEVPVVIWSITEADERALDRYEGVAGGYYTKEHMTLEIDGEMQEALVYIMTPHGFGSPDVCYLETIARGYTDFGLDAETLWDALAYSDKQTR